MMTTNYKTNERQIQHASFGGTIYFSDFNTDHANGTIAQRIAQDWAFDMQCKRNMELRNRH